MLDITHVENTLSLKSKIIQETLPEADFIAKYHHITFRLNNPLTNLYLLYCSLQFPVFSSYFKLFHINKLSQM